MEETKAAVDSARAERQARAAALARPERPAPLVASRAAFASSSSLETDLRRAEESSLPEGDGLGATAPTLEAGGNFDPSRLVQERIAWVARLLSPALVRRAQAEGAARVALSVNRLGYIQAMRVVQSTGSPLLDAELEPTVHFAEPFPLWEGWLTVTVDYQRRE